jgi:hypothetical protein
MGLLRCQSSFQRLIEGILRDIKNITVYIDDLLIHTDSHEKHLDVLGNTKFLDFSDVVISRVGIKPNKIPSLTDINDSLFRDQVLLGFCNLCSAR